MRRPLPHRLALAAALAAVGLAVLAPLVAPCTAMARAVAETPVLPPTDCGHGAPPVEAPATPAHDLPARDGSCCLIAAPLPVPTAVPIVAALEVAAPDARVADASRPAEAAPTAPPARPPPLALGVLYGVQRI